MIFINLFWSTDVKKRQELMISVQKADNVECILWQRYILFQRMLIFKPSFFFHYFKCHWFRFFSCFFFVNQSKLTQRHLCKTDVNNIHRWPYVEFCDVYSKILCACMCVCFLNSGPWTICYCSNENLKINIGETYTEFPARFIFGVFQMLVGFSVYKVKFDHNSVQQLSWRIVGVVFCVLLFFFRSASLTIKNEEHFDFTYDIVSSI